MGKLINGIWSDTDNRITKKGLFIRDSDYFDKPVSPFHCCEISAHPGRYFLIASESCPWSHRVIIARALGKLETVLPLVIASGPRIEGYAIRMGHELPGKASKFRHMHQLYTLGNRNFTGRTTVPVLWDSFSNAIVSNSSIKIMRALWSIANSTGAMRPSHQIQQIDNCSDRIYTGLANAVYEAGLAQSQIAYNNAVGLVFDTLDELECTLINQPFLMGDSITEADWLLFPVLVRFDAVYATYFRCTRARLIDYPALWAYARKLFQTEGIAQTVNFDAILDGYYSNDGDLNPYGIIAEKPHADWHEPVVSTCNGTQNYRHVCN